MGAGAVVGFGCVGLDFFACRRSAGAARRARAGRAGPLDFAGAVEFGCALVVVLLLRVDGMPVMCVCVVCWSALLVVLKYVVGLCCCLLLFCVVLMSCKT